MLESARADGSLLLNSSSRTLWSRSRHCIIHAIRIVTLDANFSMRVCPWLAGGLQLLPVLLPCSIAAQGVGGSVSARATGEPIASALVQILARDSTVLKSVFTDQAGTFSFRIQECGPPDGYLYAEHLGYQPFVTAIRDLPENCATWPIRLELQPVALPELPVEASRRNRSLEQVGFYNRQRIGLGTFITRDMLEDRYRTSARIAEVIQQVPNIFRVDIGTNESVLYLRMHPTFNFTTPCPAVVYVDGLFYQTRLPRLNTSDIEAIEIYRGAAEVPAQYGGPYAACGVAVLWTRTGAGR